MTLYERFFETLPRYKAGDARLVRPTYGFIPAHSRLRPAGVAPSDRVLLVGDAAARHSPLTFCGFGSAIRSFMPVSDALVERLAADRLGRSELAACWREPAALGVVGGMALMMVAGRCPPGTPPQAINALLDTAFGALDALGPEAFGAFIRDEIGFAAFARMLMRMAARRPAVFAEVHARVGWGERAAWARNMATFAARRFATPAH